MISYFFCILLASSDVHVVSTLGPAHSCLLFFKLSPVSAEKWHIIELALGASHHHTKYIKPPTPDDDSADTEKLRLRVCFWSRKGRILLSIELLENTTRHVGHLNMASLANFSITREVKLNHVHCIHPIHPWHRVVHFK